MIRNLTDVLCSYFGYICGKACRKRPPCRKAPIETKHSRQLVHDDHSESGCGTTHPQDPVIAEAPPTTRTGSHIVQLPPSSPPPTPPQPMFSISAHIIDEKSLSTMRLDDINVFGRHILLLYFLAANPDFMLPLASIRPVFGDMISSIPQASASPTTRGVCGLYFDYLRIVITNRLRYSIDQLFPRVNLMKLLYTKGYYVIPELERGPVPILEYIVRDAMAIFNPIDYLVTFLEQVVSHYRTLTTEDDRHADRVQVLEAGQLQDMYYITHLYGQYMWDSRWAPDDKLRRLVQLFEIVTTEVFPNAFEQIASKDNNVDEKYRFRLKKFIFDIIIAIAPCFLHHYRPMKNPQHFCMPHDSSPFEYSYPIPMDQFPDLMETLRSDVTQCTSDYLEHPELFSIPPPLLVIPTKDGSPSESRMVDIPSPPTSTSTCIRMQTQMQPQPPETTLITKVATTTKRQARLPAPFIQCIQGSSGGGAGISGICNSDDVKHKIDKRLDVIALMLTIPCNMEDEDDRYWLPFKDFLLDNDGILFLIVSIILCPPKDDPVYMTLSPIFHQVTTKMIKMMLNPMSSHPGFSCHCPDPHPYPDNLSSYL